LIALAVTLLGAGSALSCSADHPWSTETPGLPGPEAPGPPVLTTLELTPAVADLCVPDNTVELTIAARDQRGSQIRVNVGEVVFSSDAPAIASVSTSGVVTAVAPGTALITATLSRFAVTRTASMSATVHELGYPDIAGVYDVTAVVTGSDGWGYEGARETGVISIEPSGDGAAFAGTFYDFRFFDPGRDEPAAGLLSGSVRGSLGCGGKVVFQLRIEGLEQNFWNAQGSVDSGRIVGVFSNGPSITGTFTAERRHTN
jgi:hypothetical protein